MTEEWRPVHYLGFEDRYEVSNFGRVRGWRHGKGRLKTPRLMKPYREPTGHLYVSLINQEHNRTRPLRRGVHQIVLGAFVGPQPPGLDSRHLDGDPGNNTVGNLAYGTRRENVRDAMSHGTFHPWKHSNRNNRKKTA